MRKGLLLALALLLAATWSEAQECNGCGIGYRASVASGGAGVFLPLTGGTLSGALLLPDGTVGAPSLSFSADPDTGLYKRLAGGMTVSLDGVAAAEFYYDRFAVPSSLWIGWTANTISGLADVTLFRDAANTLALRNGTNAQKFRVYNSFTTLDTNFGAFIIDSTATGTDLIGTGVGATAASGALRSIQGGESKALTDATATAFIRVAIPQTIATNYKGGQVIYEIYCDDDTNQASQSGTVKFTCHNLAGTEACGFGTPEGVTLGDGTASLSAPTFDAATGAADTIDLRVTSDCTGITPNTHTIQYWLQMPVTATLTPQ